MIQSHLSHLTTFSFTKFFKRLFLGRCSAATRQERFYRYVGQPEIPRNRRQNYEFYGRTYRSNAKMSFGSGRFAL